MESNFVHKRHIFYLNLFLRYCIFHRENQMVKMCWKNDMNGPQKYMSEQLETFDKTLIKFFKMLIFVVCNLKTPFLMLTVDIHG